MKLHFSYDIDKDVENFLKGLQSKNNPKPTKLHQEFFETFGEEAESSRVKSFLEEKAQRENLDFETRVREIEEKWNSIEQEFFSRCEKMFEMSLPAPIVGYISLNSRCTYNWKENYFFVQYFSDNPTATVMHELLHFYTHRKFGEMIPEKEKFNEIKEALTVLLNIEFKDLMGEAEDKGYEQHQAIRTEILGLREEGKTILEIVAILGQ